MYFEVSGIVNYDRLSSIFQHMQINWIHVGQDMNSIILILLVVCTLWQPVGCQCVTPSLCTQLHGTYVRQSNKTRIYIPPHWTSSAADDMNMTTCLVFSKGEYACKTHSLDSLYLDIYDKLTGLHDVRIVTSKNVVEETTLFVPTTEVFQLEDYISITYPQYGQLMNKRLEILLTTSNASAFDSVYFKAVDFFDQHLAADTVYLDYLIQDKEIGSWFYEISTSRLDPVQGRAVFGCPAMGYVEFVLTESEIATSRYFIENITDTSPLIVKEHAQTSEPNAPTGIRAEQPVRVCLFNGPKLDGQKQIWRQQSLHLHPDRFLLIWLLSEDVPDDPTVAFTANIPNIKIATNPKLPVTMQELQESPEDGGLSAAAMWAGNSTFLFLYAHERLKHAEYRIEDISPAWCQRFYRLMRTAMLGNSCEVVVYGNTRGFSSDVIVVDTARLLGIPVVAELLNLYMHELVLPDVIVAPSQYALRHDSMQTVMSGAHCVHSADCYHVPLAVVIAPSVDTQLFSRENVPPSEVYRHPACQYQQQPAEVPAAAGEHSNYPCLVVGFVARLSPEKNPGLFLQTAQRLLQMHPFARFTVVGDGALRAALEELTARLRISWAVHFTGWVSAEELPAVLAGMDIVVNPGLVMETFCISNIEAMSMSVPLVTFAVGGIGEYVAAPPQLSADQDREGEGVDFSVSANAVVAHRASPEALARAVLHLLHRPALRRELGAAGRRTVLARFTVQRQMQQYRDLYQHIVTASTASSRHC